MTITDAMIEAGARALCRSDQLSPDALVTNFTAFRGQPLWKTYAVKAKAALEAAERAPPHEEPMAFLIKFTSDSGMECFGSIFFEREEAEKEVAASYFSDDGYIVPLYAESNTSCSAGEGELRREVERLTKLTSRFPDLMARIIAAKNEPVDVREQALISALQTLPEYFHGYQWEADAKPAFGEKFVRNVAGNNGHGMGRQWIATTPPHIAGLAEYIAAANPDTIAMLLAELQALRTHFRPLPTPGEPDV